MLKLIDGLLLMLSMEQAWAKSSFYLSVLLLKLIRIQLLFLEDMTTPILKDHKRLSSVCRWMQRDLQCILKTIMMLRYPMHKDFGTTTL